MPTPTQVQDWSYWISLWYQARKRQWVTGAWQAEDFPPQHLVWDQGVISAADGTITVAGKSWDSDRWHVTGFLDAAVPCFYSIVIDLDGGDDDPRRIVTLPITGNGADTLSVAAVRDLPAFGYIDELADLVGLSLKIISQESTTGRAYWWSDLVPEFPDAREHDRFVATGSATESGVTSIACSGRYWPADAWTAKKLMVFGDDGIWHRVTITGNTADTIVFAAEEGWAPAEGATCAIIDGGTWRSRGRVGLLTWCRGPQAGIDSFDRDAVVRMTELPATQISFTRWDSELPGWVEENEDCFDIWLANRDLHGPASHNNDRIYTPDMFKTIRGLQVALEYMAPSFVPHAEYDGWTQTEIPLYTLETFFADLGLPPAGWTRRHPRRVRYVYPKTIWVPDADEGGGPAGIGDATPGTYQTRDASTKCMEYINDASGPGQASDTGDDVSDGQFARYVGDNFNDPADVGPDGWSETYRRWRTVADLTTARSGVAIAGGLGWLRDAAAAWTTTLIERTGMATAGDTTSLTDSGASGSYWDGTRGRWVGHTIEIQTSVEPEEVWEPRLISGYDAGTKTITWAEPISTDANARAWRIREPLPELNRWKGRTVILTAPDRTSYTRTILGNSADALFFSPDLPSPAGAGWSWQIVEFQPGDCLQKTAAGWVNPQTLDVQETAATRSWPPDVVITHGRYCKGDYVGGWLHDELEAGLALLTWTKSDYQWTNVPGDGQPAEANFDSAWTDRAFWPGSGSYYYTERNAAMAHQETYISGQLGTPEEDIGPPSKVVSMGDDAVWNGDGTLAIGSMFEAQVLSARYAYGHLDGLDTRLACTCQFLGWGIVTSGDPDTGTTPGGEASPTKSTVEFDSATVPGLVFRAWTVLDEAAAANGEVYSERIGDLSLDFSIDYPAPDAYPTSYPISHSTWLKGFTISDTAAILQWSM